MMKMPLLAWFLPSNNMKKAARGDLPWLLLACRETFVLPHKPQKAQSLLERCQHQIGEGASQAVRLRFLGLQAELHEIRI